jgi:hypothetical protein
LLDLWQDGARENLVEFRRTVRTVEERTRRATGAQLEIAGPAVEEARRILHVLEIGKPVHNVGFYDQLIRVGYEQINSAAVAMGGGPLVPDYRMSVAVPGECANCHSGVERISSTYRGQIFSHDVHISTQNLVCADCHSNARRHGEVILSPVSCSSCHHRQEAEREDLTCASCHETVVAIYDGSYMDQGLPDLMFDSDVYCEDCHGSGDDLVRPDVSICVDCHDDDYADMGTEWSEEVTGLMEDVSSLAGQLPSDHPEAVEARRILGDLERAGAAGLHNYELHVELLLNLQERLEEALSSD